MAAGARGVTSAEPTVSEILQQVQFEPYRDNVEGALDILDRAQVRSDHPDLEFGSFFVALSKPR